MAAEQLRSLSPLIPSLPSPVPILNFSSELPRVPPITIMKNESQEVSLENQFMRDSFVYHAFTLVSLKLVTITSIQICKRDSYCSFRVSYENDEYRYKPRILK